jgi:16S rRNA (uracil1498-N3)-methyltransferase
LPHRFFIPPHWIDPPTVTLSGDTARQIKTVLRMQPGDEIIVLDNSGMEWSVRLTQIGKEAVTGQVIGRQPARGEPQLQLTLYQGTLKGQKFEWVLQKGTELGVSRFVPLICRRSIITKAEALAKKYERWQRIIQEAAEQSGRGRLPELEPAIPLSEAVEHARSNRLNLMFWEEATETTLQDILAETQPQTIGLFIGPEGGFSTEEAELAHRAGVRLVTLGPRILRAETAGIAGCAAIFYALGEWG